LTIFDGIMWHLSCYSCDKSWKRKGGQVIIPTAHCSDGPLFRQPIAPTTSLFINRSFNTFRSIQCEQFKEKLSEIRGWGQADRHNVWTRAYLIPERNRTVRRQEEGKNSVYLFVFCMNLGAINSIQCEQFKEKLSEIQGWGQRSS
jgi:hypothetical protein